MAAVLLAGAGTGGVDAVADDDEAVAGLYLQVLHGVLGAVEHPERELRVERDGLDVTAAQPQQTRRAGVDRLDRAGREVEAQQQGGDVETAAVLDTV